MFGTSLVILAQIYNELSRGQAKFPRILSQNDLNDLEGLRQWPPFSIPTESILRCMFGVNLVILDQICDELSCGQGKVYGRTDRRTEREIKFIGLFGDRGHRGPYSPYKPCNRNLYIGIVIFPHIDNPQSTGYN